VSLSESFFECSEQPQSHKNRSKYEYCVVLNPSKQSGKVQGTGERSGFFSEEVGDRGNNLRQAIAKKLRKAVALSKSPKIRVMSRGVAGRG
jgi:hypothetical protein